ncbi:MAG: helix-turn-helix transcriptional regulator [Candidatus Competibacteraceae bacterium]|nr:helix-turn-helix transcriptional regulator [Candidatus Competibacteraceae bacterium]MCP5124912.1 helix-turn-helix transcriptional regulator [Gammaproteobacteria bacterium]HRX70980.1 helix-turn-helix transcriptional regulator [Candidatus Competibacteraceae bacterium]
MNAQHTIKKLRGAGWSDAAIARAVGCSQPTITRIRNGKSDPRESTACELQKLLANQPVTPPAPLENAA